MGSEEENLLQPSVPYSPSDARPVSTIPSHVIKVSAPKDAPRYQNNRCAVNSKCIAYLSTLFLFSFL